MSISYEHKRRPPSGELVIKPSGNVVSEKTFDTESAEVSTGKLLLTTIPYANAPTPEERARELVEAMKEKLTKYKTPKCLMHFDAACIYESIIVNSFFDICQECERWAILAGICAFNEMQGSFINVPKASPTTLIPWASRSLNIGRLKTSLVLGDLMHLKPESCFERFCPTFDYKSIKIQRGIFQLPKNLVTDGYLSVLSQAYPIKSLDGRILQMACRYSAGDTHVTVYADSSMRFGAVELPALLPAADLIEANPHAEVHFCPCNDILWRYITLARESKLAERAGVVVTGNFGPPNELTAMDLSSLQFHPVVIVCPKDRPEYRDLENFANRCVTAGAASVRIFSESITA